MVDANQIKKRVWNYFTISGEDREVHVESDGKVHVYGDVKLVRAQVRQLPISFGTVSGNFRCDFSDLTSLVGAPRNVRGHFICSNGELTSLEGAPKHVDGDFICKHNKLTSLVGAPKHVGGTFDCEYNPLTSWEGAPEHVGDEFWCTWNPALPVLRLFTYAHFHMEDAPQPVSDIMHKYTGQGKPGAIKAAAELIRAGYKGNARW
jgi:hypothetical protein